MKYFSRFLIKVKINFVVPGISIIYLFKRIYAYSRQDN